MTTIINRPNKETEVRQQYKGNTGKKSEINDNLLHVKIRRIVIYHEIILRAKTALGFTSREDVGDTLYCTVNFRTHDFALKGIRNPRKLKFVYRNTTVKFVLYKTWCECKVIRRVT